MSGTGSKPVGIIAKTVYRAFPLGMALGGLISLASSALMVLAALALRELFDAAE